MPYIQCIKCDFEFENEEIPERCPYCAAEGTLEYQKKVSLVEEI